VKILDRYILKELLAPFFLGVFVFTFVMLANVLIRLMDLFISKGIGAANSLTLLGLSSVYILVMTIPMSVLLAVLVAFSRLSADSEITAMRASGISIHRMMPAVLIFATITYIATSIIYIQILPDSNQKLREMKFKLFQTQASIGVKPHVFNTDFNNIVIYVNDVDHSTATLRGVFIADNRNEKKPIVVVAETGHETLLSDSKTISLRLTNGCTHEIYKDDQNRYSIIPFNVMDLGLSTLRFENTTLIKSDREMTIPELLISARERESKGKNNSRQWVEIWKKTSLPFACFVFAVLGVPLGITTRRGGRSAAFATSIGLILVYYIFLSGGTGLAEDGKLSPFIATWTPNIVLSCLAVFLYLKIATGFELGFWNRTVHVFTKCLNLISIWGKEKTENRLVRFPQGHRFPWRVGRILDRYIMETFVRLFCYILTSLLAISLIVHLFEKIDNLLEHNASLMDSLIALGLKIPYFSIVTIPFSTLVATILTIGALTKTSELVAMKSSGISYLRINAPLILIGFVISTGTFVLNESVIPLCNQQVEEAWDRIKNRERSRFVRFHRWYRGKDGDIYYFQHNDSNKKVITGFSQFSLDSNMKIQSRLESKKLVWVKDHWVCLDGRYIELDSDSNVISDTPFDERVNPIPEKPEDFSKEYKDSEEMNIRELEEYIAILASVGFDTTEYEVDWHAKLSIPLLAFIMVLIGIGFATQNPRSAGGMVGVGTSIFIGAFYFVIFRVILEIGQAGQLPPIVSAWLCNTVFLLLSVWNLRRVTQRAS